MIDRSESLETLTDLFFDAALAPDLWRDALIRLSDFVGGSAVNLIVLDTIGNRPVIDHFERGNDDAYATYLSDYFVMDRRIPRVANATIGKILLEPDVLSPEEQRTDIVYNEILAQNGMRNLALCNLSAPETFMGIGIAPLNDANPFTQPQLQRLQGLLPSLRQAVRLYTANGELQIQRGLLGDLWSNTGRAVVILNKKREVLFANGIAEEHLRAGLMASRCKQLTFTDKKSEADFQDTFETLSQTQGSTTGAFLASDPLTLDQYSVRVISSVPALAHFATLSGPSVMLVITPLSAEMIITQEEASRFAQLFSITAAETKAISAVARGMGLADYAAESGLATDTVRKQLKSAMGKCGVNNQKALISRLERFCFLTRNG
ncbi:helix-turn-helix transcriptional regulator [Roseibium suaedae]|uniref:HTH luxR-type domain-containing protein n=1 Tax=Roseibium suaedae TaxID=735517 RepID=A0A1M7IQK3_9HYPH|nr:hypothetical protein [Roseibium suaedae]SHM42868.1 hypothetical protein SAMN05444272_2603 [Roseibium suaedae]